MMNGTKENNTMADQSASPLNLLAAIANEHRAAVLKEQHFGSSMPLRQGAMLMKNRPSIAALMMSSQNNVLVPALAPTKKAPVAKVASASTSSSKPVVPKDSPKMYLAKLFKEHNVGPKLIPQRVTMGDFDRPSVEECEGYNLAAHLVRQNDLEKIRELHKEGKNLDVRNRVGESLLHLACRRGHVDMADFLLNEAQVRWDQRDDFGRTVLHDACWRPTPSVELMEVLLKVVSPEWLMAQDVRGHTPFDYSRKEHTGAWYAFLVQHKEMLKRRLSLLTSC